MIHACFACYWPSLGHEQAFTASFHILLRPLQQFFQVLDRRHEVTSHLHLPPATPAGAFMSVYVFRFGEAALRDVHPSKEALPQPLEIVSVLTEACGVRR